MIEVQLLVVELVVVIGWYQQIMAGSIADLVCLFFLFYTYLLRLIASRDVLGTSLVVFRSMK